MAHRPVRVVLWLASVIAHATYRARLTLLNHPSPMTRLLAERDALREEVARLEAQADILRGRIAKMAPRSRPHYPGWLRLEVLLHRRRWGLSLVEAARIFALTPQTLSRWDRDAERPKPQLVKPRPPLHRLADVVRDLVRRLKIENAAWGTRRVAQTLVRAGVRLSRSSVQRILREPRPRRHRPRPTAASAATCRGPLRAKRPGHVWIADLMCWDAPFRLRRVVVAAVLDLYSRLPVAVEVFSRPPTAREIRRVFRRAFAEHGQPRHLVTDRGVPFRAKRLVRYLTRKGVRRRYGAVGRPQAVAAIDRFFQTFQREALGRWMLLMPVRRLQHRGDQYVEYFSKFRPHQGLGGATPHEVHHRRLRRRSVKPDQVIGLERRDFAGQRDWPVYRIVTAA